MIQKIGLNLTTKATTNTNKIKKEKSRTEISNATPLAKPSSNLLQSYYVSFTGKKTLLDYDDDLSNDPINSKRGNFDGSVDKLFEIENNLSYHGQQLFDDAKAIAKKHQHKEINQIHIIRAALENTMQYIEQLNSGEIAYEDETSFATPTVFEDELGRNVFKSEIKRNKIKPIIENEIKILDKLLEEMPKNTQSGKKTKIGISKDLLNDVYSLFMQDNEESLGDGLVHDSIIFGAALFPNNDKIKKEITVPFRNILKDEIQLDKRPLAERTHLSFYDDKAENIWKNLAVGTNMALLYEKETSPSYLVNSFLHVFEANEKGFGKLNKNNTEIINLNDNGELDNYYLNQKIRQFAKDPAKNYVMIMSIMDRDMDSIGVNATNVSFLQAAPPNVKFVMVADKDCYYKENTNSDVKDFFSDFGEISMPLMNMEQTKKMFAEQPKLMAKIKKPFSKPAIDLCIESANVLKGNYPEKAQKVMDLVSSYHVDKPKISLAEVQEYIKEAKEIFKPIENDGSIKVVFDTGIKLKDMVGTPTTKKEAKSIVSRIKDKTIGTKGFVIYSQDGSVGAGRKYTARAIAGEAKIPYIELNAVDFGTKDVDLFGSGNLSPEASMKKLFGMVKAQAETNPSKSAVVFIENFEYFSYGEYVSEYHEKAMSQLIREMNKAQEQGLNIVVMGSMGDPQLIGDATSKSFKFIDKIEVDTPGYDTDARAEIIDYYIKQKGIKLAGDSTQQKEIKKHINMLTEYGSYIEILTLLDKAKNVSKERHHSKIDKSDITEAFLQIECGRPSSVKEKEYKRNIVASHECGHALNNIVMNNLLSKINKEWLKSYDMSFITLDARSNFGGAVFYNTENGGEAFESMFADLVSTFGGNSCEHRFFGQDGSFGIRFDMMSATNLATNMAGRLGQAKYFGKKSIDGISFISEKDKDNLNKDIDVLLKNAQIISDAITQIYEDFNKEFTKKYESKVNTGDCIIQKEEFVAMFNDWKAKQSPEKQKEFVLLDEAILKVIEATKNGVLCDRKE